MIGLGRAHYRRQWVKIMGILEKGEACAFEISRRIYPGLKGWEIFSGISEVQSNLDFLAGRCMIKAERRGKAVFYH